jgi:hypothetical protein
MAQKASSSLPRKYALASAPPRSKYGNKPCVIDGEKYRSVREANRHQNLLLFERAGLIAGLRREVPFVLADRVQFSGRWKPALRYVADFVYTSTTSGLVVVEDCKGVRTYVYRIKRHLMLAVHGITILET